MVGDEGDGFRDGAHGYRVLEVADACLWYRDGGSRIEKGTPEDHRGHRIAEVEAQLRCSRGVVAGVVNFSEEPSKSVPTPLPPHHRAPPSFPHTTSPRTTHLTAVVESLLLQFDIDMAAPEVHHLFHHPIADHSFSADRQTLAVARENNVDLYAKSGSGFKLQDELTGHDKTVTGVDIAPNTGKIVTCSQGKQQASCS